jgi:hypothetical protein
MPTKRSVKKVEIADDSVVNLKKQEREKTDFAFQIRHIEDVAQEPVESAAAEIPVARRGAAQIETKEQLTTQALLERSPRSPKYDPDELNQRMESFAEKLEKAVIKVAPTDGAVPSNVAAEPKDLIRVKFEKFVQLVASKDFLSVLEKNKDEDIVLSSNLLTELASAVEEKSEKKSPVIFLVGLAIGVIITYLLIK